MTYSWNQLRPCGFAALTSSIEVVPSVERVNGMPAAPAADAPAISPSVCMSRVNPVGAMPNGSALGPPRISIDVSTSRRGAEDAGVELDVLERLARAGERELALGGAIGVVERRLGRAALRDRAQIGDRERGVEAALAAVELGLLELHELEQLSGLGELAGDHGGCLSSAWRAGEARFGVVAGDVVVEEGAGACGVARVDGVRGWRGARARRRAAAASQSAMRSAPAWT